METTKNAEPPRHPEITVELIEQAGKPVAQLSLVRRALQRAGHQASAQEFTTLAFQAEEDELLDLAGRYVTVA